MVKGYATDQNNYLIVRPGGGDGFIC